MIDDFAPINAVGHLQGSPCQVPIGMRLQFCILDASKQQHWTVTLAALAHQQEPPNPVSYTSSWKFGSLQYHTVPIPIPKHRHFRRMIRADRPLSFSFTKPTKLGPCSRLVVLQWMLCGGLRDQTLLKYSLGVRSSGKNCQKVNKNDEIPKKRIAKNDKMLGESAKNHVQVWIPRGFPSAPMLDNTAS